MPKGGRGGKRQAPVAYKDLTWDEQQIIRKKMGQDQYGDKDRVYVATGNSFQMNDYLRKLAQGTISTIPDSMKAQIDQFSALFKPSIESFKAIRAVGKDWLRDKFRGMSTDEIVQSINKMKGLAINDGGFMSTSINTSQNVFTHRPVLLNIKVPKGTSCYFTNNKWEGEIVLDKGTKLSLESAKVVRGKIIIDCTVAKKGK